MWRPGLRADDIDAERQVILDEILMHADEPSDLAAEQCTAAVFPDHPLGREVLGSQRSVGRSTTAEIRAFFDDALPRRATWWWPWPATSTTTPGRRGSRPGSPVAPGARRPQRQAPATRSSRSA